MKNFIGTATTIGANAISRVIANTLISGLIAATYDKIVTQNFNKEGDFFG